MGDGGNSITTNRNWIPFTIDHLLQKHGLFSAKSLVLILIWVLLIAGSFFSVWYMMSGSWINGQLNQDSIHTYFLIYPPLIIGTLLVFWFGFEWGFVPVFLATFVMAYAANMPFYWAILFAIAFVLGLGIYAISYYCVPLDKSLRDFKSFAFFVVISFFASISSSLGAFVWSLAHDLSVTQSTILWRGWWTGVLLQSVVIVAPLLFLLTSSVEKIKQRFYEPPPANEVTLHWIYGAILSVSVVLGIFIVGSNYLGTQIIYGLMTELTTVVSEQFIQATTSFQTITWISISMVLSMGLGGIYLVGSWNKNLEEIVETKTSELEESRLQLENSLQEKEEILDGIHFRMRSNLTTMLALLEIQLKYSEKKNPDEILEDSYSRLQSLAIVYETMHQTKSLNSLNLKLYTIKVLNRLSLSSKNKNKNVESVVQSDTLFIDLDRAIPLAIVLNELIEDAYQNAAAYSNNGILRLTMNDNSEEGRLEIEISDNRRISPSEFSKRKKSTLSLKLTRLLIDQLKGSIDTTDQLLGVLRIKIPLKENEMKQNKRVAKEPTKETVRITD